MSDNRTRFVNTTDGRKLAVEQYGDPEGTPVFMLHGTPGCRLSGRHPDESRVVDAGLRLITYDRPGYGQSDRHKGRRVIDCVADVAAIADELGVERFAVTGGSGGGPHALAVAARLPGRVTRVGCDVGVAPYDAPDFDWLAGMDPANVKEFEWALAGEDTLLPELEKQASEAIAKVEADPTALLNQFELSPADRAILEDPRIQKTLRASTKEAFVNGVWGWVDDDLGVHGAVGIRRCRARGSRRDPLRRDRRARACRTWSMARRAHPARRCDRRRRGRTPQQPRPAPGADHRASRRLTDGRPPARVLGSRPRRPSARARRGPSSRARRGRRARGR